jgi:DNA-binding MurR/RpiR family transcriptional regulator
MDKIERCAHDVLAMATAFGGHDLAEAKRRIEILFADADKQTGEHSSVAHRLHDRIKSVLKDTTSPAERQSLNNVVAWLRRDHFGN